MAKKTMKIILVAVSSINGKITRGNNSHVSEWSSPEDGNYFFSLIKANNLIVMGSKTYEASKPVIKLVPEKLRIVFSHKPEKYEHEKVSGQLEFTNEPARNLVERLEKKGLTQMLLVGGGDINAMFLKADLVDEVYLTIEPKIFGEGRILVKEDAIEIDLELLSVKKLNKKGTILLKYKVI